VDVLKKMVHDPGVMEDLEKKLNELTSPRRRYSDFTKGQELEYELNARAAMLASEQMPLWEAGTVNSIASREEKEKVPKEWRKQWLPIAREEFLALRYVAFIRFGLRQMRSSFEFLSYGFIVLVIALNSYPFRGHHKIDIVLVATFIVLGASVVAAFAQMDRDPLLSRLNDSKPNELGANFVWRVISFGSLPLLTLIASVVPSIGHFVSSWVQPTLQALK
jgi:hypothetical protein